MTRHFRIFDPALVPGALQTRGYATVRLSEFAGHGRHPGDISATVAVRMERARLLSRGSGACWASTRCARPWRTGM